MAHTHDVYDTGKCFEINETSRFIKETSPTKLVLVQGDHKSEVITFKMPRYIDGHDMLSCNKTRVHYINIDTKTNDTSKDIYEVKNLALCEDDESMLTFTWVIEAPATKYAGTLSFLIKFECTEGDDILYQWNTAKYVGTNVLVGIDNSEAFIEKYSSVLEQWYNELTRGADSIEEFAEKSMADIETAKNNAVDDINEAKTVAIDTIDRTINESLIIELVPVVNQIQEEVLDARDGYDGTIYPSLGSAVRRQMADLKTIATDPRDHYYWQTFNFSGEDKTFVYDEDLKNSDTFRNGDSFTFKYLAKDKDLVEIVYVKPDGEEVVPDWTASSGEYEEVYLLSAEGYVEIRVNSYVDVEFQTRIGTVQDLKNKVSELEENIKENGTGKVNGLPEVSSANEGCILRVVNGAWELVEVANAEDGEY